MGGRKLTAREAIASSYPGWDHAMSDRLIAWLDHCGYEIIEKNKPYNESSLVPSRSSAELSPNGRLP